MLLNVIGQKFNSSNWTASTTKQPRQPNPNPGNKYEYKAANSWQQYNSSR